MYHNLLLEKELPAPPKLSSIQRRRQRCEQLLIQIQRDGHILLYHSFNAIRCGNVRVGVIKCSDSNDNVYNLEAQKSVPHDICRLGFELTTRSAP